MDNEERFQIGAQIRHPSQGICTITSIGDDYVGVRSENGQEGLIRKDLLAGYLEEAAAPDEQESLPVDWPDNTFVQETEDQPHYLGSRWGPFCEDPKDLLGRLPEIFPQASTLNGFGADRTAPREAPANWHTGTHLCWPGNYSGLVITLRKEGGQNQMASMYPYICRGKEASIELCQVSVWHSGVEAQIDASWGNASITFFDVSYLLNRCWYEAGKIYQFILAGLAYQAKPCEANEAVPFEQDPEIEKWQREMLEKMGAEALPSRELDALPLAGAAILMPIQGWDRDDYWFCGTVRNVETFDNWLSQSGWQVRVTVQGFRDEGEDGDLDIFITQRAWAGDEPPQAGQAIEGEIWLNGYLWRPSQ